MSSRPTHYLWIGDGLRLIACGLPQHDDAEHTEDRAEVTCRACKRTYRFRGMP